jgi:hypothetical protein
VRRGKPLPEVVAAAVRILEFLERVNPSGSFQDLEFDFSREARTG